MIKTGLVSVTFRPLSVEEIISLVAEAKLDGIEWGGDVHVPHGDIAKAEFTRKATEAAGLAVAGYGSYYRIGEEESPKFEDVLASTVALGTPKIRVWIGRKGSEVADAEYCKKVIEDAKRIADMAAMYGIMIVSEWHGNTLMDKLRSAQKFLAEVGRNNFKTFWQPLVNRTEETCLEEINIVLPHLAGMHVFAWDGTERLPLAHHLYRWGKYFAAAAPAGDFYALLEFVEADSPKAFLRDAAVLKEMTELYRKIS